MNLRFLQVTTLFFALAPISKTFAQSLTALKTEYLVNPIGLDNPNPRFTWQMNDASQGAKQTAYRILLDTDSASLVKANAKLWNTGWVKSDNHLVIYSGQPLKPFTKYFWRVDITDGKQKKSNNTSIASFETGMMKMENWQGAWISDTENIQLKPAPYFRKTFTTNKKIRSARAYIAAAGLYELSINGKKIGNHRMDPMYTRFDRRTLYVTYDVTPAISQGKNAIGILLGNGWYNHQSTAVWYFDRAPWRNRPAFCLDIRITYEDGTTEIIKSGKEWKTALSPIIFNSIYTAEHYDSRLEKAGWNMPNFDDTDWKNVIYRSAPSKNIVAQAMHPIRNVEQIASKSLRKFNDTTYLFDLGRNISGVSKITLSGPAGTVIKLKHGERLYANGHVDISNIDAHYRPTDNTDPFQTDILILNGKGEQSFMPHFNYKGFQYVEVSSSIPIELKKENLVGYFMHSDVPVVGDVKSSESIINKIYYATNNSYLSNLFGYPTDCPQREKNGWTGDAQIAIETGLYGFDGITIYEKWLADHRDEQQPNGVLPSIIPTDGWGYEWGNGPDWTSTIAIIPWNVYLFYGDKKLLADCYENIRKYVNHIDETYPTGLITWGLGDWIPVKSKSPVELTSTCYYYADVVILAKAAKILGKNDDYEKYIALAKKIKGAFNAKYLNKEKGIYNTGIQTEMSVPLYWKIVPEESIALVAENLAKRVEADGFHLDVGLLGTKAILNALSENGYSDIAYKVAAQKTYPSWGWWMENSATTLYENWPIDAKSDISMNHIMFGEIGAWLYKSPGGIKPDEKQPGFKHVILDPHVMEGLNSFEASHIGPYGKIVSAWKRINNGIRYDITIPANSTATINLPLIRGMNIYINGKINNIGKIDLEAGKYIIEHKASK
ncbi:MULTISPECIES: alpha-L-rhamnosidase [unclassified Pedobacter]|uniref:alpha-L-rhamnosidase n=1 Tax=unclassified Pedobacter TaxID=2628915 RepID=UPI0014211ECF|nr:MULTISPECIES: alpha-L-rhamnosidase [unclassified Pedobacter]NII83571.1 alpha-L-rhamnosidase [Pedobacter sp. SG908]NMN37434.1 alpha-L-rhamnosidase [Pedobacter sp. SG918]